MRLLSSKNPPGLSEGTKSLRLIGLSLVLIPAPDTALSVSRPAKDTNRLGVAVGRPINNHAISSLFHVGFIVQTICYY